MVQYYTTCSANSKVNNKLIPFKLDLNKAESKLRTAATLYNDNLIRMSYSILGEKTLKSYNFQESITNIESILDNIRSLIKCEQTSKSYKNVVNILCTNSM